MIKLPGLTRLSLLLVAALSLAVPGSTGFASAIPYPVGKTDLRPTGNSTVDGTAFVRNYASGETHVQLRLTGLPAGGRPVVWRLHTQSPCGSPPTKELIRSTSGLVASRLGTALGAELSPVTLTVTGGQHVAIRVYAFEALGGVLGPELACGELWSLPDTASSRHSW
jgi:hypothetical protein